jgi:hypothetical protein
MKSKKVIWPEPVVTKLRSFRSEHFTLEETYDFIVQLILETEELLLNPIVGRTYVEEYGEYRGYSRVVISKFRTYYKTFGNGIVVMAVLFPGEC